MYAYIFADHNAVYIRTLATDMCKTNIILIPLHARRQALESLQTTLPPSVQRISAHIDHTFSCIDEASRESPAWTAYLRHTDSLVLAGLKKMVLTAIFSLVQRASQYEQGHPIPPLVTVEMELQAHDVQFSPPLSMHSALDSVPEVVQRWIEAYIELAKLVPLFERVGGGARTCYEALCGDAELKSAVGKISAHLETNARHCQVCTYTVNACVMCVRYYI